MKPAFIPAIFAVGISMVSAHGYFQSPGARQVGDEYKASCGEQAYNNLNGDINNNIQGLLQLTSFQSDFTPTDCNLWMCKGLKYADNTANVQNYSPGQEVDLYFQIIAPHSGFANVSILDTQTNSVIAQDLKKWNEYALTSEPMKDEWQHFSVTIPSDLGSKCSEGGNCVMQMHWDSPEAGQTYQSCIDFKTGGAGAKRRHARDVVA